MGGSVEQVGVEVVEGEGGVDKHKDSGVVQLWIGDWLLRYKQIALCAN